MSTPLEICATPSPLGNRIDLEWVHPDPEAYPGVRIVRRRGTWPTAPYDGKLVVETLDPPYTVDSEGRRLCRYTDRGHEDQGLAGETVFYYMLFPFRGSPPEHFQVDVRNRAAAMATAPYGYGARLAAMLPAIYHRYDSVPPPRSPRGDDVSPPRSPQGDDSGEPPDELLEKLAPEDRGKGPMRRLLDITGSQLDQLHSLARSVLDLHDLEQVDARLLPLLAGWIGWPTDHRLEPRAQRSEIRRAPHIYRTIGLVPTVEATVKRILGWESRTKELAHNVFLSNQPERLNLWLTEQDTAEDTWSQPTEPLSLNFAYEGRPAAAYDGDTLWLFFHTLRKRTKETRTGEGSKTACRRGQWDVWYKTFSPKKDVEQEEQGWTPSRPLTDSTVIDKHPSAALQKAPPESHSPESHSPTDTLWVFWDSWSESDRAWHLCYRTRQQGSEWSERQDLWHDPTERRERRLPQAVADGQGQLWLFWLERMEGRWKVRCRHHNGTVWESTKDVPTDAEEDLFVCLDATSRLWIFWSRRDRGAQGRWRIAYRISPDLENWGDVKPLPPDADEPDADDREPAAVLRDGNLELYWSSNRTGNWSIRRATLSPEGSVLNTPENLTGNPFSQRAPLPVAVAGVAGTRLFYYSNESRAYDSETYRATRTVDGRYAGSTTVDTRNAAKTHLWGSYQDFQTYTFGTAAGHRRHELRYAHDTVALHVTPSLSGTGSGAGERERHVLERVLRQFLPTQVRAMLVIEAPLYQETVYTYDVPEAETPQTIRDGTSLELSSPLAETYDGVSDDYTDRVTNWVRIYSWSPETPSHRSVDTAAQSVDTSQRTWHVGLEPGFDFSLPEIYDGLTDEYTDTLVQGE